MTQDVGIGAKSVQEMTKRRKRDWVGYKAASSGITIAVLFSSVLSLFQLALPLYSMQVFDRVLPSGSLPTLLSLSLMMTGLTICSIAIDASRTIVLTRLSATVDVSLHQHAMELILEGKVSGLSVLKDVETMKSFTSGPMAVALLDAPWSIAFVAAIFLLHPVLGWLAIAAAVAMVIAGVVGAAVTEAPRIQAHQLAGTCGKLVKVAGENYEAVAALGIKSRLLRRIMAIRAHTTHAGSVVAERQAWIDSISRGFRSIIQVMVLALAATLVISHGLATGAIVASSMLLGRALAPVERLGAGFPQVASFFAAHRRVKKAMNNQPKRIALVEIPKVQGLLELQNVFLVTPGRSHPILRNVSLTVKPGQFVVIVGREGSGKSALSKLISGSMKPSGGVVRLDGSNIEHFGKEAIANQLSYLPQTTIYLPESVAQFIAGSERPVMTEVVQSAELMQVHGVIQRLPSGYNTDLSTGQQLLSGGEKQRISLARLFYGSPKVIVMDEPTAGLDDSGETALLSALEQTKKRGSTVVVISRLPGLLHLADQLIMLDKGEVRMAADQSQMQSFLTPRLATSRGY